MRLQATAEDVDVDIEEDAVRSRKSYSLQAFHQVSRLTKHELLPGTRACARQMSRMEKSIESTKRSFATVRTGRANPSMLDRVEARPSAHPHPAAPHCCLRLP